MTETTFQEVDEELAARVHRWLQQGTEHHRRVEGDHIQAGPPPVLERRLFCGDLGNEYQSCRAMAKIKKSQVY